MFRGMHLVIMVLPIALGMALDTAIGVGIARDMGVCPED